jgi:hypothetical protein
MSWHWNVSRHYKGEFGEIKISARGGSLYGQATGQQEFPLKAISPTKFAFAQAQLEIDFDAPGVFTLKQGTATVKFKKVERQ